MINLKYGFFFGAEDLLRWQIRKKDTSSRWIAIRLAEETGLILTIGLYGSWKPRYCAQLIFESWKRAAANDHIEDRGECQCAAILLGRRCWRQVQSLLEKSAVIIPKLLKLELTESLVLADVNDAFIDKMHAIMAAGRQFFDG